MDGNDGKRSWNIPLIMKARHELFISGNNDGESVSKMMQTGRVPSLLSYII